MKTLLLHVITLFLINFNLIYAEVQWEKIWGPYGGSVNTLKADSTGKIYLCSAGYGLGYSSDDGENWNKIYFGIENPSVNGMCICPNGAILFGVSQVGIIRQLPDGKIWENVYPYNTNVTLNKFAIDKDGTIYTNNPGKYGLIKSPDNGRSWEEIINGLDSVSVISIIITPNGTMLCGSMNKGLFRSSNSGGTWVSIDTSYKAVRDFMVLPDGSLFMGTQSGVYKTTDNGDTWKEMNNGIYTRNINCLASVGDLNLIAGTNNGIYISSDKGENWSKIRQFDTVLYVQTLAVNKNGYIFSGSNNLGIYRSIDTGNTWVSKNNGFDNLIINVVSTCDDNSILAGTVTGLYKKMKNENEWLKILPQQNINAIHHSGNYMFVGTAMGGTFRSSNCGESWEEFYSDINRSTYCYYTDNKGFIYAGANGGLIKSTDAGQTWTLSHTGFSRKRVNSIGGTSDGILYAGTQDTGLFRSTNGGELWEKVNSFPMNYIRQIGIDNMNNIYVIPDSGGFFRSTDKGNSWENYYQNYKFRAIAINKYNQVIVGTENYGILYSENTGNTWSSINDFLDNLTIKSLHFDKNNFMYALTNRGINRSTSATSADEYQQFSNGVKIYPVPADDRVNFLINEYFEGEKDIEVYNLIGEKLIILKTSEMNFEINTTEWETGIYYWVVKSERKVLKGSLIISN